MTISIDSSMRLAGVACLLILAGCNSNNPAQGTVSAKGGVAATVNGTPINENLVAFLLKQRTDLGRPVTEEIRSGFIDRLVMQLVISQEAARRGLDNLPDVSAQIEISRQSVLANAFIQDYLKNVPVSDEAVSAEYEKMRAESTGKEYKARHILLEQEAEARAVIASLKKDPKVFDTLAREKSRDTGSRGNGGELGWFDPRKMVPEFGAAVAKLPRGGFTGEPVKSQFGYHVILLEDSRQIVLPPPEQVKPGLKQKLQQQSMQKYLDGLKAQAKVEIMQAPAAATAPAKDARQTEPPGR